jgi:hypothetical protein
MKNPLSDIYEQVLLNEAEKHALQNPSQDEVGNIKAKQDLFGSKPKAVEGPDKAKLKQGPQYKETTGTASKPSVKSSSMPNSAPAKETKTEKGEEMEDTKVDPTNKEESEEKKEKKPEMKKENFAMGAFEALFKKTITEELDEEMPASEESAPEASEEPELDLEDSAEELEDEEGDLISDLRDLQDKLSSILSKLEDVQDQEEDLEDMESEDYTEEQFDEEFGDEEEEEEEELRESKDKPTALNNSKGKALMSKKNKVGRIHPKGGKANSGKLKSEPTPKSLGDKKAHLQKGKPEVKSSVKKGDFIK